MPSKYERTEDGLIKCPHCEYAREKMSTVTMHVRAKHAESVSKRVIQDSYDCPCEGCSYKSDKKAGLRNHFILNHLWCELNELLKEVKGAGFECVDCKKQFKSRAAFVYHVPGCLPEDLRVLEEVQKGCCI
jgi:transposase